MWGVGGLPDEDLELGPSYLSVHPHEPCHSCFKVNEDLRLWRTAPRRRLPLGSPCSLGAVLDLRSFINILWESPVNHSGKLWPIVPELLRNLLTFRVAIPSTGTIPDSQCPGLLAALKQGSPELADKRRE